MLILFVMFTSGFLDQLYSGCKGSFVLGMLIPLHHNALVILFLLDDIENNIKRWKRISSEDLAMDI